jgi:hypothetical protein
MFFFNNLAALVAPPALSEQICYCKSSNSYKLRNAGHISYTRAREILLEKLDILDLDKNNFGLHSLRAGGATNAARLLKKNMGGMSVRFHYNNITAFSVFICLTFFYED